MPVNKAFFRTHPPASMSFARLTWTKMCLAKQSEGNTLEKLAYQEIPAARRAQVDGERKVIEALTEAEAVVRMMRGGHDVLNQSALVNKAVELQETVMPLLLRRYLSTVQDSFVENAAFAFAAADPKWARQLLEQYPLIGYDYARAQACIVFAAAGVEGIEDFLLEEFARFEQAYPEEPLKEGPLVGLYILAGKV